MILQNNYLKGVGMAKLNTNGRHKREAVIGTVHIPLKHWLVVGFVACLSLVFLTKPLWTKLLWLLQHPEEQTTGHEAIPDDTCSHFPHNLPNCVISSTNLYSPNTSCSFTADGRYLVIGTSNQYGTYGTYAFDRSNCQKVLDYSWEISPMEGSSGKALIRIAPISSRVVLADGTLVDLASKREIDLPLSSGRNRVSNAVWSEDETYLAYRGHYRRDKHSRWENLGLYIATGDGAQWYEIQEPRILRASDSTIFRLEWVIEGQENMLQVATGAWVSNGNERAFQVQDSEMYRVSLVAQQLQVTLVDGD
jgi:hypothetical protein